MPLIPLALLLDFVFFPLSSYLPPLPLYWPIPFSLHETFSGPFHSQHLFFFSLIFTFFHDDPISFSSHSHPSSQRNGLHSFSFPCIPSTFHPLVLTCAHSLSQNALLSALLFKSSFALSILVVLDVFALLALLTMFSFLKLSTSLNLLLPHFLGSPRTF